MRTPIRQLALQQIDRQLPELQRAAAHLRARVPREGWVRSWRISLGLSMRGLAGRLNFKAAASVKALERNERDGTITLNTLRRAAAALDADFVYAIVPREALRTTLSARAEEVARRQIAPLVKSMALEAQGLTGAQIERQVRELARELARTPERLWR